MAKLKLGPIADDKPVKVTIELPASLHRDCIPPPRAALLELECPPSLSPR